MSDPTTPFPVTQPEEVSQKFEANNSISGGSVTVCCLNDTGGGEGGASPFRMIKIGRLLAPG